MHGSVGSHARNQQAAIAPLYEARLMRDRGFAGLHRA